MKEIKVSVIIPIYNAEEYLEECLNSVINQTLKEIEIICVNDGSTDNSLKIIEQFQRKSNKIKLISQKNAGVIKARITGLENATGKYIGWIDSDDFIDKNMFSKLYKMAEENNADISFCNYNFYPNKVINKKKWYKPYEGATTWEFINANTIQWNKIVKKELIDKINLKELFLKFGEGSYGLVLIKANTIISTDECLYNYRVGHTSLSSNFKNIEWFKATIERTEKKYQYVKDNKYGKYWEEFFNYVYLYYSLILIIVAAYNNDKKNYKYGLEIIKKEKLFSKKYIKYLNNSFSPMKLLFLKNVGTRSFLLMRVACKIILK